MAGNRARVLLVILVAALILLQWEDIWVNTVVLLTLQRGVISQNCFWWSVNDLFPDSTGTNLYEYLKQRGRIVPLTILGRQLYLLTDIQDITQLLEGSPTPFGPGVFKKNFFDSFIPTNVGISIGSEWTRRRDYNDTVLEPTRMHSLNAVFAGYIGDTFATHSVKTFQERGEMARKLTSKIVFGTYDYNSTIYSVFKQADSVLSVRFNTHPVNPTDLKDVRDYMRHHLEHPTPGTLLAAGHRHHAAIPVEEILDQIPHWVFPIAGLFAVHLPRLLVLLANHPDDLAAVVQEVKAQTHSDIHNHCRKCILELFRLNNAVNSTFRGLTESFQFDSSDTVFEAGTEFVFFNNPVLRELFDNPNRFDPSRWTNALEDSTQALMFNHGNQECPGKELVITILTSGLVHYLRTNSYTIRTNITLDPAFIPYMINPCTITFE